MHLRPVPFPYLPSATEEFHQVHEEDSEGQYTNPVPVAGGSTNVTNYGTDFPLLRSLGVNL